MRGIVARVKETDDVHGFEMIMKAGKSSTTVSRCVTVRRIYERIFEISVTIKNVASKRLP